MRLLPRLFTLKSLAKSLAKSLGSDPMHDSRRDSLGDSFFYAGLVDELLPRLLILLPPKGSFVFMKYFLRNSVRKVRA